MKIAATAEWPELLGPAWDRTRDTLPEYNHPAQSRTRQPRPQHLTDLSHGNLPECHTEPPKSIDLKTGYWK